MRSRSELEIKPGASTVYKFLADESTYKILRELSFKLSWETMQHIENLKEKFDLIFMDIWEEHYSEIFTRMAHLLQSETVIICDNMLTARDKVKSFKESLLQNICKYHYFTI
jgi:predicted O-methyltransferase YrrM